MPLELEVEDARWRRVKGLERNFKKVFALSLKKSEISKTTCVLLSNDKTLKRLNHDWRGKNKPTNVLSFPAPSGQKTFGDIALGYETCEHEARASGKSLLNHSTHLMVHGLLHLQGFDHTNEGEAKRMETREIRILAKLGIANPYVLSTRP